MKFLLNIVITICVGLSIYILYNNNLKLKSELISTKEINKCADSCMVKMDSLIDELERSHLLPEESQNLEDYLTYKAKLDSIRK